MNLKKNQLINFKLEEFMEKMTIHRGGGKKEQTVMYQTARCVGGRSVNLRRRSHCRRDLGS